MVRIQISEVCFMYEQNKVSIVGRVLWLVVSMIVIVTLIWLVLWLFFWRHPKVVQVADKAKQSTSQVAKESGEAVGNIAKDHNNSSQATTSPASNGTSNTQTAPGQTTAQPPSSTSGQSAATTSQTSSVATQAPSSQLVNTGAGDVVWPAIIAIAGGATAYHIRLRRKNS